ncbi:lipocalin family protein [Fusobacterium perfoetens]|jgi:apolipoprotein D and lipocalin family protein|uniref:lipocalin family protein n=1 Tax=Fusobacterium perfoetens TaxID=852 RepID=UPI0026EA0007|nr:lipocalin family protein [Fusobacterium perfoetens]
MTKIVKKIFLIVISLVVIGCSKTPIIEKNQDFNQEKYLGRWYEIKRIENRFERGLKEVTADYTKDKNGKILVLNSGVSSKNKLKEFRAFLKPTEDSNFFKLYPSFFPIWGSNYNVAWVDEEYRYAIVTSSSYKYLWFLSREKTIPEDIYKMMLEKAQDLGYNTDELIDGQ